jgi:uncharacterized protein (DUF433 family)
VWVLVGYRRSGRSDKKLLDSYPSLTQLDLDAAWAYANAHPEEIEKAIRDNEEREEGFAE